MEIWGQSQQESGAATPCIAVAIKTREVPNSLALGESDYQFLPVPDETREEVCSMEGPLAIVIKQCLSSDLELSETVAYNPKRPWPEEFNPLLEQMAEIHRKEVEEFRPYTHVTVNHNRHIKTHRDQSNLDGSLAAIAVIEGQGYKLVFPEFDYAVEASAGDLILANVHELHGNLPSGPATTVVAYVR